MTSPSSLGEIALLQFPQQLLGAPATPFPLPFPGPRLFFLLPLPLSFPVPRLFLLPLPFPVPRLVLPLSLSFSVPLLFLPLQLLRAPITDCQHLHPPLLSVEGALLQPEIFPLELQR